MPYTTFVSGPLASSTVQTYLMNQANIVCTSTTRPASPVDGMIIYETDTTDAWRWNASLSTWVWWSGVLPWTNVTLSSGIAAFGSGYQTPQYCLDGSGMVRLRGLLQNTSASTLAIGTVLATLPAGFRPAATRGFTVESSLPASSYQATRLEVSAAGTMYLSFYALPPTGYVFLDGLSFDVAP